MASIRARLARRPPGYEHTLGRILAVYAGLMTALFLASLDQTIIATALPTIVTDLGGVTSYSWAITSYLVATTVTVPLFGKLSDVFGRRRLFLVAIVIFLAGSALCGIADSMIELVLYRAVQGVGAGGIFPLALATTGALVPPRERGRYQGLVGATFAGAAIAGPALGGLLVDQANWRWIFYVNLPIGGVALVLVWLTMPKSFTRQARSVDWLGAGVLGAMTTALLLGLVWGGREFPWGSWEVVGALAAAAALIPVFALAERRASETILPFALMRRPGVAAGIAATTLGGVALMGTVAFVPLFVQGVLGTSATSAGVVVTPFIVSAVVAGLLSGQWVSRTGRYKGCALAGFVVLTAALVVLSRFDVSATETDVTLVAVAGGIGLGLMIQVLALIVQNAVPLAEMGSATALIQFARTIGGTIGITVMGVIVSEGLPPGRPPRVDLPQQLPAEFRAELADAMQPAFLMAAGVCVAALAILLVWLREVPLRRSVQTDEPAGTRAAAR